MLSVNKAISLADNKGFVSLSSLLIKFTILFLSNTKRSNLLKGFL